MDAFFYYSDLTSQMYLLEIEKQSEEIATQPETESDGWIARLGSLFSKIHQWFSEPIQAEAEEAYQDGRMPLPYYHY